MGRRVRVERKGKAAKEKQGEADWEMKWWGGKERQGIKGRGVGSGREHMMGKEMCEK